MLIPFAKYFSNLSQMHLKKLDCINKNLQPRVQHKHT